MYAQDTWKATRIAHLVVRSRLADRYAAAQPSVRRHRSDLLHSRTAVEDLRHCAKEPQLSRRPRLQQRQRRNDEVHRVWSSVRLRLGSGSRRPVCRCHRRSSRSAAVTASTTTGPKRRARCKTSGPTLWPQLERRSGQRGRNQPRLCQSVSEPQRRRAGRDISKQVPLRSSGCWSITQFHALHALQPEPVQPCVPFALLGERSAHPRA